MKKQRGSLIVLSGASGVGKSTVIAEILKHRSDIHFSVSFTTRAPRAGEAEGVSYHFTDKAGFDARIASGDFLEHAQYVGNCYGTSKSQVEEQLAGGIDVLLDIEVQGAMQVRANMQEAILVFVLPPSFEELEKRLRSRGTDSEDKILGRLQRAQEEMREAATYDYLVVNETVELAAQELLSIMQAARCRVSNRKHLIV